MDGNQNPVKNRFLYQGKELQDEAGLQLYDFHARQYDPQIGRFWGIDPMDEFPSGYTGMGNSPANMIDPDGMQAVDMHDQVTPLEGSGPMPAASSNSGIIESLQEESGFDVARSGGGQGSGSQTTNLERALDYFARRGAFNRTVSDAEKTQFSTRLATYNSDANNEKPLKEKLSLLIENNDEEFGGAQKNTKYQTRMSLNMDGYAVGLAAGGMYTMTDDNNNMSIIMGYTHVEDINYGITKIFISPWVINSDNQAFTGIVGHEIVHAYNMHYSINRKDVFPQKFNMVNSERAAYNWEANYYLRQGNFQNFMLTKRLLRNLFGDNPYPFYYDLPKFTAK